MMKSISSYSGVREIGLLDLFCLFFYETEEDHIKSSVPEDSRKWVFQIWLNPIGFDSTKGDY